MQTGGGNRGVLTGEDGEPVGIILVPAWYDVPWDVGHERQAIEGTMIISALVLR